MYPKVPNEPKGSYPSKTDTVPQSSLSEKENKFLQHFKTINNIDPLTYIYNRDNTLSKGNEELYMSKLQSYSESKISQIVRIMRSTEDQNSLKTIKNGIRISPAKPVIHTKPQIKKNLQKINAFFTITSQQSDAFISAEQKKEQYDLFQTQILQIGVYSEILEILPFKAKEQPKPQVPSYYSIYNTPTERPLYEMNNTHQSLTQNYPLNNFTTETERNEFTTPNRFTSISLNQQSVHSSAAKFHQPEIKIRKADMLLVQILREKKRKGLVPDYYKIMELKLFQLLDFILQDQPDFQGLSSIQKMKEVLKKLQSFKGKKVQGENKINLLKIFFQEFRNLKNEMTESEKKKPLQKVQNKPRPPVKKQVLQKEMKQSQKKSVPTAQRQNWLKRTPLKQTLSMGGEKKERSFPQGMNRSVKGIEDQWLGELQ